MSDSGPGRREVAYRLFAAEFDDAEFSYSESDEERAPNFVVTPTGARVNRLFAVGVLTEVEDVNPEMVRGRVVDPTGAFVTYAGQYQPDELAFLERTEPPTFLALSGKARTFEPDDGDRVYTSVRPESVSEVDAETRDRWVVTAAERTLERVGIVAAAIESGLEGDRLRAALEEADVDERLADGVALALEYYGTTPAYLEALRETALEALEVVAGDRDEVGRLDVAPDEGVGEAAPLATLELSEPDTPAAETTGAEPTDAEAAGAEPESGGATAESPTTSDPDVETGTGEGAETGTTAAAGAEPDATTETGTEPGTGAVSGTDPAPEDAGDADVGTDESDVAAEAGDAGDLEPEDATEAAAEPEPDVSPGDAGTEATAESVEAAGQEPGAEDDDFDPGEFELDEEERREVEEEYGTEFSTADEVESPDTDADEVESPDADVDEGAAGADAGSETPTEAEMAEEAPGAEAEASAETEAETADEPAAGEAGGTEAEPEADDDTGDEADAGDVDLEDAVMGTMEALDDGDGADQEELVATVADEHGADPEAVEDAIQDALMSGRCYEPSDGVLKSI